METIMLSEFQKLELRIGVIREVSEIPGLACLLKLRVDLGDLGERGILAGIRGEFPPESLVGTAVVVLTNLAPKVIKGELSEGMLLAAVVDGRPVLISPRELVPAGTPVL